MIEKNYKLWAQKANKQVFKQVGITTVSIYKKWGQIRVN